MDKWMIEDMQVVAHTQGLHKHCTGTKGGERLKRLRGCSGKLIYERFAMFQGSLLALLLIFAVSAGTSPAQTKPDIFEAVRNNNVSAAQAILKKTPAALRSRDKNGWSPLHLAVLEGYEDMSRFLLEQGASVSVTDNGGYTPLHWAAVLNHRRLMEPLITAKSDVNAKEKTGRTPLHYAVRGGWFEITSYLLDHGADPNITNKDGHTAMGEAALAGKRDLIYLLRDRGGRIAR